MRRRKPNRKTYRQRQRDQRQRRLVISALGIIAVLIAALLIYQFALKEDYVPEVSGAAAARVNTTLVDHGYVQVNRFVESKFEITNVGDELLFFYNQPHAEVIEGCCPPTVNLSKMELKPGETATISMNYTMHEGMDGPHEFHIKLMTNDPEQPEIVLTALSDWG